MGEARGEESKRIATLISEGRRKAYDSISNVLIDLDRRVGKVLSLKILKTDWGEAAVDRLAAHLANTRQGIKGITRGNLFWLSRFYEANRDARIVAPLVRQLLVPGMDTQSTRAYPASRNPLKSARPFDSSRFSRQFA